MALFANRLKSVSHVIAVGASAFFFALVWQPVFAQFMSSPPTAAPAQSSPDDVERQRLVEEKIEAIRREFVAGNFSEVLRLCEEAEQIVPRHPSVGLYREWARQKLQRTKIGEHADVDRSELPTDVWATTPVVVPGTPSPSPVSPQREVATNAAVVPSEVVPSTPSAPSSDRLFRLVLLAGILAGALIVGYFGLLFYVQKKRKAGAPAFAEAAAPAPSLMEDERPTLTEPEKVEAVPAEPKPPLSTPFPTPGLGLSLPSGAGGGLGLSGLSTLQGATASEALEKQAVSQEASQPEVPSPAQPDTVLEPPPLPTADSWTPEPQPIEISYPSREAKETAPLPESPFVSFEDLGIEIPMEPSEQPPSSPQRTYSAAIDESRIVITPVPSAKEKAPSAPETPLPEAETFAGPPLEGDIPVIQLEDIVGGAPPTQPPSTPATPTPLPEEPQVELNTLSENTTEGAPPLPEGTQNLETFALDLAEGEMDGLSLDTVLLQPTPPQPAVNDASTVIEMPAKSPESGAQTTDDSDERTRTLNLSAEDSALAETKAIELPTTFGQLSASESVPSPLPSSDVAPSANAAPSEDVQFSAQQRVDERSERMFREQLERGLRAFEEQNYKQAVHFLSIAAAIHPENQEVREKLRAARERKRQQESSGR